MSPEEELREARRELEEYDKDVREGKIRPDPAYRRALLMRIDILKENLKQWRNLKR